MIMVGEYRFMDCHKGTALVRDVDNGQSCGEQELYEKSMHLLFSFDTKLTPF